MGGQPVSAFEGSNAVYCFGPFRLDLAAGLLFRADRPVPLTPKAFDTLLYLVEREGRLVTKDDLMQALWPDVFVTDSNLTQTIFMLRKALGDGKGDHRYIATVVGRGYRFVAQVERASGAQAALPPGAGPASARGGSPFLPRGSDPRGGLERHIPRRLMLAGAAVGVCALIAVLLLWLARTGGRGKSPPASPIRSIAVLPLKSLSSDSEQAYFAVAMTDELITRLAELPGLRVISHTSVLRYQGVSKSLPEIASELHVDAVVEGTILHAGDRVRISAQLVSAADDRHLWAESYERDLRDVLDLQNEIARDIAWNISLKLNPEAESRLANRRPVAPRALQLYLRGRYHWRSRRPPDLRDAIVEFQQAIATQPDFARAYAGLADCYVVLPLVSSNDPAPELYPKAKDAAEKALALDPSLAEVHTSLAYAKLYEDWDFAGAEREFQRALSIDPNYSTGHQWYAELLSLEGRRQEAIAEIRKAEELDPFSAIVFHEAGQVYRQARQYEQAIAEYKKSLSLDPHMLINDYWMADVYLRLRMVDEAGKALRAAFRWEPPERYARNSREVAELEAEYFRDGLKGWTAKRMTRIEQVTGRPSYFLALGYATLGNDQKAFQYLSQAHAAHDSEILTLNVDPEWDRLHSDPRFIAMVKKVGLPQAAPQQTAALQ